MLNILLISVGILIFVAGTVAALRQRDHVRCVRLIAAIRPALNAPVHAIGPLRIDGEIFTSEQPSLVAPCSGELAVWFRVRLRRLVGLDNGGEGGGGETWATIAEEQNAVSFYVDDGTGTRTRVNAADAQVLADAKAFRALAPESFARTLAFLNERGIHGLEMSALESLAIATKLAAEAPEEQRPAPHALAAELGADLYEEEILRPGENVCVVGSFQKDEAAPPPRLYRDAQSSELVLRRGPGSDLIVATRRRLLRELSRMRVGRLVIGAGIMAVIGGLVIRWIAPDL